MVNAIHILYLNILYAKYIIKRVFMLSFKKAVHVLWVCMHLF